MIIKLLAAILIVWVAECIYDTVCIYLAARNIMRELGKDVKNELRKASEERTPL